MKQGSKFELSLRQRLVTIGLLGLLALGVLIAVTTRMVPDAAIALSATAVVALLYHRFSIALVNANERLSTEIKQRQTVESDLQHALKRIEDAHRSLLSYDQLTGLPNRALFLDRVAQEIEVGQRRQTPFALLFLDLDRFKYVNNTLGHPVGDEVLSEVARRLKASLRGEDTVSRVGGDMVSRFGGGAFCVLMRGAQNPNHVGIVAERITAAVGQDITIRGHEIQIGASIGIAHYPTDGADVETLVKHAEAAMYRAKELGGKQYRYFEAAIEQRVASFMTLNAALRHAIERNEFMFHYQPVVRLADREVAYYEGLIRWQRGDGQLVMPGDFIEFAENSGLIVQIGRLVIDHGCRQARELMDAGFSTPISINASAKQFQGDDLPARIREALQKYQLDPAMLEIEITESALIEDPQATHVALQQLTRLGIGVAIDDFGAGHSSLNYLVDFPISKVKIDRRFVHAALDAERHRIIVSTIIDLGRQLGIETVAEGVEREEQNDFLQRHGCEYGQGYLYGKPQPPEVAFSRLSDELTEPSAQRAGE